MRQPCSLRRPLDNHRYSFLLYNASVYYWWASRPLQREGVRSHLLASQDRICQVGQGSAPLQPLCAPPGCRPCLLVLGVHCTQCTLLQCGLQGAESTPCRYMHPAMPLPRMQALEKVEGQQDWKVRHLVNLGLCQADAGEYPPPLNQSSGPGPPAWRVPAPSCCMCHFRSPTRHCQLPCCRQGG